MAQAYNAIGRPGETVTENLSTLELQNGSRIVALPGREETIRSLQGVKLMIIDEAARVPDDLYYTLRPMLGVSRGRLVCLSTPFGQRGFFWKEWLSDQPWRRFEVPWSKCPRLTPQFIDEERKSLSDSWVDQEYNCLFTAMEGLVYPDFGQCVIDLWPCPMGKPVGGIDFGWRNPFAAVWGALDRDDVLWLGWERYQRECPLHEHVKALKQYKNVTWYADPAGRTEIEEMRAANLVVRRGDNEIRSGIAAVTARIKTGRLKVCSTQCWNLIAEAKLYRYPKADERSGRIGEVPIDQDNHALAALRYLVSRIDARFIARLRGRATVADGLPEADAVAMAQTDKEEARDRARMTHGTRFFQNLTDDDLWTTLN